MLLPVTFKDRFGEDLILDIGIGNRNEKAFSVVFPEPMSAVDDMLNDAARASSSYPYLALRDFLLQTGHHDLHRMQPRDVVRHVRNAFIQQRLVLGRPPRLFGTLSLQFDGKTLELLRAHVVVRRWARVSGRTGYQGVEHQETPDTGPLPEGQWLAPQSRFERIGPYGGIVGFTGRGTWPGSTTAWGRFRVWLEPVGDTKTFGRSGFSIHGGTAPGSAGCVDLTSSMDDFSRYFLAYGRDTQLAVKYPASAKPATSKAK